MDETMYAYLAGIIDGEGSISARFGSNAKGRNPTLHLDLMVINTNTRLIAWLLENFGGRAKPRQFHDGRKVVYEWVLAMRGAANLLPHVLPYMLLKREQAEIALKMASLALPYGAARKRGISPELQAERAALLAELRRLNRKGSPDVAA
jgi:hypothetical protein